MPSENKTPNFGLNQWKGNEYPKREDFLEDNSIIDTELKDTRDKVQNVIIGADNKPAYEYLTVGTRGTGTVGTNSLTSGSGNVASGDFSHSEGFGTVAGAGTVSITSDSVVGNYTHAEGNGTQAAGNSSHSEGKATLAGGINSHAEGFLTATSGPQGHSEGEATQAFTNSHAEGLNTFAGFGTSYNITAFNNTAKTITLDNVTGLSVGSRLRILRIAHDGFIMPEGTLITAISGLVVTLDTTKTITADWNKAIVLNSSGLPTHAEGYYTVACGNASHAEGLGTLASGTRSHAEGDSTLASGPYAHSEGSSTIASGNSSHAEGSGNRALGMYSHAEGFNNIAVGDASHVEGSRNVTINYNCHAEGDGNFVEYQSHAEGYGNIAGVGVPYKITAFDNTAKTVTLANVTGLAVGGVLQVRRIPVASTPIYNIPITNITGLVVTLNTTATIDSSWTYMIFIVSGATTHAEGRGTMALGGYSHTEGFDTQALASFSHAEGSTTISAGATSHAEGDRTQATGISAHSEGTLTTASGAVSHAEGGGCFASGDYSHAEGLNTTAGGGRSHAEGESTTATGMYSHAEGASSQANAIASHAGGSTSQANGDRSFAHGLAVRANGADQAVFGRYNVVDTGALFIIGKGTSDAARSNAFIILADGTISSAGHCYSLVTASNITMVSGFTPTEGCVTERSGRHVELQLFVAGSIAANTPTVIGNVPNVIDRPTRPIRGTCIGGNGAIGWLIMYTDGNIQVNFPSAQGSFAGHSSYFSNY